MKTLINRLRWMIAAPVIRPILKEWEETARLASQAGKSGPREWRIECIARSELNSVHKMEIEQAFGCTHFDGQHHYVRNYS